MGRRAIRVLAGAMAVVLLIGVGSALAIKAITKVHLQAGNIVVDGEGGFTPTALPKDRKIPITAFGRGKVGTADGTLPPVLKTLKFEFDKNGGVETTGLPICTAAKLQATTVPQARKLCPGSIVGKGFGKAVVKFPEQPPIPASSPLTVFNGPPKGGDPSVYVHAYLTYPAPTTFVVPVRIERISNGRYGYRVSATIPKIAGGSGIPISGSLQVGRKWTHNGVKHSYIKAQCPDGRLQGTLEAGFLDGTRLNGTFLTPCKTLG